MSDNENSLLCHVESAKLGWTAGGEPRSTQFEDQYFTACFGIEESSYVFLQHNDLPARWQPLHNETFTIAETGFGTGLNFLLTLSAWRSQASKSARLHYISLEAHPLTHADLHRCLNLWPILEKPGLELFEAYPVALSGNHRLVFDEGRVILDLCFCDAAEGIRDYWLDTAEQTKVDTWYLDGFAPSRNESMWCPELLQLIAALSQEGTTFSTFTAASQVRRHLQESGFTVEKVPGYGVKREMLKGRFNEPVSAGQPEHREFDRQPWHRVNRGQTTGQVIVLGAGLAGCTTARTLADRGWQVQIIEAATTPAAAASGNGQGVLYTRVSARYSTVSEFALRSFLFSLRQYRRMFASGQLQADDGRLCGVLHTRHKIDEQLHRFIEPFPTLAAWLDEDQASAITGIEQCPAGMFFPGAGWLNPPALCQALLNHPSITLSADTGKCQVLHNGEMWQVVDSRGITQGQASIVVLCTGTALKEQQDCEWLPLDSVRGQVSILPACHASEQLKTVICHEGYLCPTNHGVHHIGATYDLHSNNPQLDIASQQKNLESLARSLPDLHAQLAAELPSSLNGRVGFRCTSPDYLPVVGPVPDMARMVEQNAELRRNAKAVLPGSAPYQQGLFVNAAHGSRGLTSTPLSAELLASLIEGGPSPLSTRMVRALSPTRFIIRDLIRNKR